MAFHVPPEHAGLFEEIDRRFRLLLFKNIVTGVSELQFDKWLKNFLSVEDQYLAARLLENLTFRSEQMVGSAIGHILQCILPAQLRRAGVTIPSIDEFVYSLRVGGHAHPVRFVEVEDGKGTLPGKSGPVIMRELHRLGGVSNSLMCHAESLSRLPDSVRCLVFVDDMLGTGTQFKSFAARHDLRLFAPIRTLVYCPLAADITGVKELADKCNWLTVCPVEEFGEQHRFFRGDAQHPDLWAIDRSNTVADVREHMRSMFARSGVKQSHKFALDLLIGFHHATPNNTLGVMYAESPTWHNLLVR